MAFFCSQFLFPLSTIVCDEAFLVHDKERKKQPRAFNSWMLQCLKSDWILVQRETEKKEMIY